MKVEYISHYGDDLFVVNVARASFDKWSDVWNEKKDVGLINYLAREGHDSPFFHPKITLRITASIFVARQWERHRVGVCRSHDMPDLNEVSRRYVDSQPEYLFPEWRDRPDKSIKQGSGQVMGQPRQNSIAHRYEKVINACTDFYHYALDSNTAPEQARMVLPQSMYTTWIETGSLMYWARFYKMRAESHAQKEIQEPAQEIAKIIEPLFPVSWPQITRNRMAELKELNRQLLDALKQNVPNYESLDIVKTVENYK